MKMTKAEIKATDLLDKDINLNKFEFVIINGVLTSKLKYEVKYTNSETIMIRGKTEEDLIMIVTLHKDDLLNITIDKNSIGIREVKTC